MIETIYFWVFLIIYGVLMVSLSPAATTPNAFFSAFSNSGDRISQWSLTMSIFISWIFAKSVTNAANLAAAYGIVGGLAYAMYWLSIPLAGIVIYLIRKHTGATGLIPFLIKQYGRSAALAFSLAIFIRLYNEIWSNTAVVGAYFGQPGDSGFIIAALVFTAITLIYSIKGGLRSSIFTDGIQAIIFVAFLFVALLLVLPHHTTSAIALSGSWQLSGGVDLLLVALLQIFSYPFHDPVLTDRGFITDERSMLRSFIIAGIAGFICIFLFSLIGVHAYLSDMDVEGNAPYAVASVFGILTLFVVTVIMISSAGSTLDSTFNSLAKLGVQDLKPFHGFFSDYSPIKTGIVIMIIFAIFGNLPMFAGTDILKATTISGTMVMGLAPIFLLYRLAGYSPASFHCSFWIGVILGILYAAGLIPEVIAIGEGKYGLLLATNLYGLALCTLGYLIPLAFRPKTTTI